MVFGLFGTPAPFSRPASVYGHLTFCGILVW
jgi:hypothetical protein